MQNFDIVTIRVFLAVARNGSIGAAAKAEHLAASAVSRRISDLEYNLGVTLFSRTPSGAVLTPAGEALTEHCEKILGQFARARVDLKRYASGEAGELRISAVTSAVMDRLPESIARFQKQYPNIEITLTEIYSADGLRLLREDLADLIIIADTVESHPFEAQPYKSDPVWVVSAADHPLFQDNKANVPIEFTQTLAYEHLSVHEGGVLDDLVMQASKKARHPQRKRICLNRFDSMCRCVEAGLGLGFLRESAVRRYIENGTLSGAPLADSWADRSLICIYPKSPGLSPTVSHFLAVLDSMDSPRTS